MKKNLSSDKLNFRARSMSEVAIGRNSRARHRVRSRRGSFRKNSLIEPITKLNKIKIKDNGEPLVDLTKHCPQIAFNTAPDFWGDRVKDYDGRLVSDEGKRRYCKLGHGQLDFIRGFRALREAGFSGLYTVEVPSSSLEEAQEAINFVRERLLS